MDIFVRGRLHGLWLRLKDAVLNFVGRSMEAIHAPAKLKPFEYIDPNTNEKRSCNFAMFMSASFFAVCQISV
jgi:hypothetical protein